MSGTSADFSNGELRIQLSGTTGSISNDDQMSLSGALTLGGSSHLTLDLGGLTTSTGAPITTATGG